MISQLFSLTCVLAIINMSCGKSVYSRRDLNAPESDPVEEQPQQGSPSPTPRKKTNIITDFLRTEIAEKQVVRKDHAQIIVSNSKGEIAVAGVTRSRIAIQSTIQPSLAGDLFFTRYSSKNGWDSTPIQVPVEAPVSPDPSATPQPLAQALVSVKGGRLLESGKALVVGEIVKTFFSKAQLHLDETKEATTNVFLTVFGAGESGMMRSVRLGLTGENTVAGTADGFTDNSIIVAGTTATGLRRNSAQDSVTEVSEPSNYVMELDADGRILRNLMWPMTAATVSKVASNETFAFIASNSADGRHVYINSLRWQGKRDIIVLPSREVCADASDQSRTLRVASVSASEKEVVVAVEISDPTVTNGNVMPCFEVFEIRSTGLVVNKREQVFMPEFPSLQGTVNAQLVENDKVLLLRSRENSDSRGRTTAISTFLFERPLSKEKYESKFWSPTRPADWYGSEDVNGVSRVIQSVARSKGDAHYGAVWVVANDLTKVNGEWESLVNVGTYLSVSKEQTP
jgi:hypothetical protein